MKLFFLHLLGIDNKVSLISHPLIEEGQEHPQGLEREGENQGRAAADGNAAAAAAINS